MAVREYAASTNVSEERTQAQILKLLREKGATNSKVGWEGTDAEVRFTFGPYEVAVAVPMPDPEDRRFTHLSDGWRKRAPLEREKLYAQACRARWRLLLAAIQQRFRNVEGGVSSWEREWLGDIEERPGVTVADIVVPQLRRAALPGYLGVLPAGVLALPPAREGE